MENYIVKFKSDLKKYQSFYRKFIKECENELGLLEKLINCDFAVISELNSDNIIKKFKIMKIVYGLDQALFAGIGKSSKKKSKNVTDKLESFRIRFTSFVNHIKQEYMMTQNIINAFENDKIKDPINELYQLYFRAKYTSLTDEEISRIIGMAIYFDSQYAQKNKNNSIQDIDIISKLALYYNQDGTFKYNEDIETFEGLMKTLFKERVNDFDLYDYLNRTLNSVSIIDITKNLLKASNEKLKDVMTQSSKDQKEEDVYTISPKCRKALQELRKYYKNGSIIEIPENLEYFYKILEDSELDEKEKLYIINLLNKTISDKKSMLAFKYLNHNQRDIYEKAINLLNLSVCSKGDMYILKQYIEELQTIFNMLLETNLEEDREYLLGEIQNVIGELSIVCDRYTSYDDKSSNKYIFLLNKNNIPYVYSDVSSLDLPYRRAACSLIPKIDKGTQSQFKKVLTTEPLLYNMYEICSPRAHIAFVEVDLGIYVIIGADIPRKGYKELINRLKANEQIIKEIEEDVKNQDTRDQILKENEEFLALFTEGRNTSSKISKRILKPNN